MTKKKASKKATLAKTQPAAFNRELLERIDILESNVDRIDKRVVIISDGLAFIADNCRQMFNMSGLAVVIDAITAKFK